ncbi:MAG: S-4TM family putative pore-forming effector, partial [bacterium]
MNDIFQRQNQESFLDLLKIQKWVYNTAKKIGRIKIFLFVVLLVLFAFIAQIIGDPLLINLSTLYSLLSIAGMILFSGLEHRNKRMGVRLQNHFDTLLFHLDLASLDSLYIAPTIEEISALQVKYGTKTSKKLENWYADYSGLLFYQAVRRCQEENIRWDGDLRASFLRAMYVFVGLIVTGLLIVAVCFNVT